MSKRHGMRAPLLGVSAALATLWATSPALAELRVVATIKPVHSLAAQVLEGIATPTLLVDGAASPHSYALKPSDAKALNAAHVVLRVSEQLEPFTGKVVKSLPKSVRVVTLADAKGLTLLATREGGAFEKHQHGAGKGHDHDHGHGAKSAATDGHIWLDPENAKILVGEIASALSAAAPEHAETLKANASATVARIDALAADIARDLEPVRGKPFLVFHDAYQYLERRYDLNVVGSVTVSPETLPGAKTLANLRKKVGELKAVCAFAEPQYNPKVVLAVTEGTKARSGTLDPEGATIAAGRDAYFELMRVLSRNLKDCLGGLE